MAPSKAGFDSKTGNWNADDGTPIPFLPEIPAESPPYDLISSGEVDRAGQLERGQAERRKLPRTLSPDGFRHYPIGADSKVVEQIVAYYEAHDQPVPDGYAQAAADHAAAAKDQAAKDAKAAKDRQAKIDAAKAKRKP